MRSERAFALITLQKSKNEAMSVFKLYFLDGVNVSRVFKGKVYGIPRHGIQFVQCIALSSYANVPEFGIGAISCILFGNRYFQFRLFHLLVVFSSASFKIARSVPLGTSFDEWKGTAT